MRFAGNRGRSRDAGGQLARLDPKHDRKSQQLCRQAHRALMYVLPGEMADPLLQDLWIESVLPAPDASRLLVRLVSGQSPTDAGRILDHLSRVSGHLRAEVAAAITRKRAPELVFHLSFDREVES